MKKTILITLILFSFIAAKGTADEILNVDFTRDSVLWKEQFADLSSKRNIVYADNFKSQNYTFKGVFGVFSDQPEVRAQPICLEDNSQKRRWAFRLDNNESSCLELPNLPHVGRITIFCKNESSMNETEFYIQRKKGNKWKTIKTVYLPPHYEQNYEQVVEEYLNINKNVKLRLISGTNKVHVYGIRVNTFDKNAPKKKPCRLILLPDPQAYAHHPELNFLYGVQTMWIANNSDSITFVLQQGDLTQKNSDPEFKISAGAMTVMHGKKVPYTIVPGNHDIGNPTNSNERVTTNLNKYYPVSFYSRVPSFGGAFEDEIDNTWHTFTWGGYKFLILSLEFGPRNKVLEWAKKIVEQHPKHNVILNTHAYLFRDNTRQGSKPEHITTGRPQSYGLGKDTGDEYANDGQEIWDKLVKHYPNFLFTFNGHVLGSGIGHQVDTGIHGNKVYQFLANYQGGVEGSVNGGNGFLRIVDLDPDQGSFRIKTYSPYTNEFKTEEGQEFYYEDVKFIK